MGTALKTMQTFTTKMETSDIQKCWELPLRLHGITPQKTTILTFTAVSDFQVNRIFVEQKTVSIRILCFTSYLTAVTNARHVEFNMKIDHKHAYVFWSMEICMYLINYTCDESGICILNLTGLTQGEFVLEEIMLRNRLLHGMYILIYISCYIWMWNESVSVKFFWSYTSQLLFKAQRSCSLHEVHASCSSQLG